MEVYDLENAELDDVFPAVTSSKTLFDMEILDSEDSENKHYPPSYETHSMEKSMFKAKTDSRGISRSKSMKVKSSGAFNLGRSLSLKSTRGRYNR